MRNLKKLLALVLAMVMTFSLMLSASAVDFDDYQDKDSITAEFDESVRVLTGLAVMQGDEKGFRPSDKITRAEAAAVIYRAVTGDVTDRQTDLYKDYSTFTDVKSDDWFAGYVGYCQNAGYIKGTSPTTFNPYGQVTGYEVLAMILRAVGYGKNNEFTGSSWQVNVAALSKQLGVTRDVTAAHMEQTLNMAAPREVVADLVFMTMATVPMVTYTPALAYNDKQGITGFVNIFNSTLGQQTFGLFYDVDWQSIDAWGRPGYNWYKNGVWQGSTTVIAPSNVTSASTGKAYVTPADHPLYTAPAGWSRDDWDDNTVATITFDPSYATNEQVLECDVAHELEIDTQKTFRLFVNGTNGGDTTGGLTIGAVANNYRIVATDTVTKVGGQGRVTEFYNKLNSKWFQGTPNLADRAVIVDTVLAVINAKRDAKLDPAGHVITPAQLEVTIWDGNRKTSATGATADTTISNRILSKATTDATNWDQFSTGDYILLNTFTSKVGGTPTGNTARTNETQRESAAFETNKVVTPAQANNDVNSTVLYTGGRTQSVWIVDNGKDGIADSKTGKQTTVFYNQGKHAVDGTEYKDQLTLFLDKAGTITNTTFTWYFDQFGNLIGIGDAHSVKFGVITGIYAAFGQGTEVNETTGGVKAVATVKYADGTTGTEYIDKFRVSWGLGIPDGGSVGANANRLVPNTGTNGFDILYPTGYRTEPGTKLGTGGPANADLHSATAVNVNVGPSGQANIDTLELIPVYDEATHPALSVAQMLTSHTPRGVAQQAWLYLAPSTATNTNAHFANGANTTDAFRVLYDNMYMFSVADDNSVIATEVAGSYDTTLANSAIAYTNTNSYFAGMANGVSSKAATAADAGKLYKSLSYLTFTPAALTTAQGTAGTQQMVYVDNNTQIMVRLGARSIVTYDGVDKLQGDVTIAQGAEIDWADTDNDGRAEFVYISGGSIPSTITYGLFYYNGTGSQWEGSTSTGSGTITGYLNGKLETLTFDDYTAFSTIQNSVSSYDGHLFAVQMEEGKVVDLLEKAYADDAATFDSTEYLLMMPNTTAAAKYPLINLTGGGLTGGAFNAVAGVANGTLAFPQSGGARSAVLKAAADGDDVLKAPVFGLGAGNGNSYTANTRAVYYKDFVPTWLNPGAAADTLLTYEHETSGNRIAVNTVGGAPTTYYWLAPNCEIIGELDWLNTNQCDVTIVYEEGQARSVTQLYIARDPDITPTDPTITRVPAPTKVALPDYYYMMTGPQLSSWFRNTSGLPTGSYWADVDLSSGQNMGVDAAVPPVSYANRNVLIKYDTTVANATPTLVITDRIGRELYRETPAAPLADAGGHFFYVNLANKALNVDPGATVSANWSSANLPAGDYYWTIAGTGATTAPTGAFYWNGVNFT